MAARARAAAAERRSCRRLPGTRGTVALRAARRNARTTLLYGCCLDFQEMGIENFKKEFDQIPPYIWISASGHGAVTSRPSLKHLIIKARPACSRQLYNIASTSRSNQHSAACLRFRKDDLAQISRVFKAFVEHTLWHSPSRAQPQSKHCHIDAFQRVRARACELKEGERAMDAGEWRGSATRAQQR